MCGIVGYIGQKQAYSVIINGLKKLEYRGYDSAGISVVDEKVKTYKCKGKIGDLEKYIKGKDLHGVIGIGHTRWATHGEPNDTNAHPHRSQHGPIALIDENMPVVVIAPHDDSYEKIVSNIQEVKARGGIVIAVVNKGDKTISEIADHVFEVPSTVLALAPLLTVIPLQLLSYHIAVLRSCNVDQPRNLAKSVTVE